MVNEALADAYVFEDVCTLLDISEPELQRMIVNRDILAHDQSGKLLLPKFQFIDGNLLPHWAQILKSIRPEVPVFAICRFMTSESAELVIKSHRKSPREWLINGLPANAVAELGEYI